MIIVIADDLTGAAELAGIGLRYNLQVEIAAEVDKNTQADLLVVYTNTRSLKRLDAISEMQKITATALALEPFFIYKKTDSVLRGHVLAEMKAQMEVLKIKRGLLVPANPVIGRTIKDGNYYIHNVPVHQTGFSLDPEFPVRSSLVADILADSEIPVAIIKKDDGDLQEGISVGEAENMEDVVLWSKRRTADVFVAGGASFFDALLQTSGYRQSQNRFLSLQLLEPMVLISGTTFNQNVARIDSYKKYTSYMPQGIFLSKFIHEDAINKWADDVVIKLTSYKKGIVAIGNEGFKTADSSLLRQKLSEVTRAILYKVPISELLIEGGATAYSIIQHLGFKSFYPTDELSQGVVRMAVSGIPDLFITIKPGSYNWPDEWNFN
jgi:D-threonate/D-erythronate kinase